MTVQEVIKYLRMATDEAKGYCDEYREMCEMSIQALEKQIPKKPLKVKGYCYKKDKKGKEHYQTKYLCPVCRKQLLYCGYPCKCGQLIDYNDLSKLDWEEGGTSD